MLINKISIIKFWLSNEISHLDPLRIKLEDFLLISQQQWSTTSPHWKLKSLRKKIHIDKVLPNKSLIDLNIITVSFFWLVFSYSVCTNIQ
jgi:hypothetical protein